MAAAVAESPLPRDALHILDLLQGYQRSKVMFTLVSLGVMDLLPSPQEPPLLLQSLATALAATTRSMCAEANLDSLGRLLDAGVALGLLEGRRADGYRLSNISATYLTSDSPESLAGYVRHSGELVYRLWAELGECVLTGSNAWGPAFGRNSEDVYAAMYSDEASLLRFLKGMHGMMKLTAVPVLNAFDLSRFKRVVDLGGATGALAAAAAGMCRQRTAIVMDLPHVVSVAQRHFAPALVEELERAACGHDNSSGVQTELNRLAFVGGDFFDTSSPLPPAELYMLGRILHNWDEGRIATLLARVHDALPPGGGLLIAEMLLDEDQTSPAAALLQSLSMLTQAVGRERTLSQYTSLLQAAGFERVSGVKTGAYLDAVLAEKRGVLPSPGGSDRNT